MHYTVQKTYEVSPISWKNGQAWSTVRPVWVFTLDGGAPVAVVVTLPTIGHLRAMVRSAHRRGIPRA